MRTQRSIRRCIHGLTLLALVLATLAPSLAHALRYVRGDTAPWSVMCSASGIKRVMFELPSDDKSPDSPPRGFEPDSGCVFCSVHGADSAPSPVASQGLLLDDLAHVSPASLQTEPPARPHRCFAQPRAPPL